MKKKLYVLFLTIVFYFELLAETITGLTVLVDFPDDPAVVPINEMDSFFNQDNGFTGFNNKGSVKEFYRKVSNGKINYENHVIGYYTADKNKEWYSVNYGDSIESFKHVNGGVYEGKYDGPMELINEAVAWVNENYSNFENLSVDGNNELKSFSISFQGNEINKLGGVSFHTNQSLYIKVRGNFVKIAKVMISPMRYSPFISVTVHEAGHLLFKWADYYIRNAPNGILHAYGLMGSGGTAENPMPPNPALRLKEGWIDNNSQIILNNYEDGSVHSINANHYNEIYKYVNENDELEYFLITVINKKNRYSTSPDEGLAVWYVNERGGMDINGPHPEGHFEIRLIQADGNYDLENDVNRGDQFDLFENYCTNLINDYTNPSLNWKNGSYSGLEISNVSQIDNIMTFTYNNPDYKKIYAEVAQNGRIVPDGIINADTGGTKKFTIYPKVGYKIKNVKVNNTAVGVVDEYTFYNIADDQFISAEFEEDETQKIPDEWNTINIGNVSASGKGYYKDGTYIIYGSGSDIWGNYDEFYYVYQTLEGDGEIISKVKNIKFTDGWAKAGLMIRESLTANSKYVNGLFSAYGISALQYRLTSGGYADTINNDVSDYQWIKLERKNNNFSVYFSNDGNDWDLTGTVTVNMGSSVKAGMFITSHNDGVLSDAQFENVQFIRDQNIYVIAASADNGGTVSPDGAVNISQDANITFQFTPDTGFMVDDVLVDGISIGDNSTYTFSNVNNNHTITVYFKEDSNTGGNDLLNTFNVPGTDPFPSLGHRSYNYIYVFGNGPDLSNVTGMNINWVLDYNGLYEFSLNTNNGVPNWYISFYNKVENHLSESNPYIILSQTDIPNLDGEYYVTLHNDNVVLVEKNGTYAIYFSQSSIEPVF